ncbi:hypothetical protein XpopCFBP1817_17020 [Xanthomonas populi]|uniref:Uncharacterized protein n=1 Tax=Xanthomonas populi TaxID=53414 RepID=A0A2S7EH78_9XANT|nr:hypothetical protein XpopCFBP1817_17020 [Xanthomonas populi]
MEPSQVVLEATGGALAAGAVHGGAGSGALDPGTARLFPTATHTRQGGQGCLVAAMRKLLVILNAKMPDQLAAGAASWSTQLLSRRREGLRQRAVPSRRCGISA